jgi:hypothetical protein
MKLSAWVAFLPLVWLTGVAGSAVQKHEELTSSASTIAAATPLPAKQSARPWISLKKHHWPTSVTNADYRLSAPSDVPTASSTSTIVRRRLLLSANFLGSHRKPLRESCFEPSCLRMKLKEHPWLALIANADYIPSASSDGATASPTSTIVRRRLLLLSKIQESHRKQLAESCSDELDCGERTLSEKLLANHKAQFFKGCRKEAGC